MSELNRDQVVKALECCASPTNMCKDCPMPEEVKDDCRCMETISRNALALIKELAEENKAISDRYAIQVVTAIELDKQVQKLTEENERLRTQVEMWKSTAYCEKDRGERTKADTVRKIQEEIEARCIKGGIYPAFVKSTIDQIAKEMIEIGTKENRTN